MSPAGRPRVSVVVLSPPASQDLPACLGGLLEQSFVDFEVLLVDQGLKNGSTDAAMNVFGDAFSSRLRPIYARMSRGDAAGYSLGLRHARGRWLATLSASAVPDPGWLEALWRAGESAPDVGMCASRLRLLCDPRRLESAGQAVYADGTGVALGRGQLDGPRWQTPTEVLCPNAAAGLYKVEALRAVGGFDWRFLSEGYDLDVGLSLRARGLRCLYVPEATGRHHLPPVLGRGSLRAAYLQERARVWLALRHFPGVALATLPLWTAARWSMTLRAAAKGGGPLADLIGDARGRTTFDDPALGRLRGRGTQLGALTRLAMLGTTLAAAQVAALTGLPYALNGRRELAELDAVGAAAYASWLRRFGASAAEAAARSMDGRVTIDTPPPEPYT